MLSPALLRSTGILLAAICIGAADRTGGLGGKVKDPGGFYLSFPKIRVSVQTNSELRYEAIGDSQGKFQLVGVEPGIYIIKIAEQGFRDKTVANVKVAPGQITDLGALRLDFAGCDAPGVFCDDFGQAVYSDPIHARGRVVLSQLSAIDIDEGKSTCTIRLDGRGTTSLMRDPDSVFWLRPGASGAIHLDPLNGTSLALNPQTE